MTPRTLLLKKRPYWPRLANRPPSQAGVLGNGIEIIYRLIMILKLRNMNLEIVSMGLAVNFAGLDEAA